MKQVPKGWYAEPVSEPAPKQPLPETESGYDPGTEAEWKLYLYEIGEEQS